MSVTTTAYIFGGPDDGSTRELTVADLACGWVESVDAAGKAYRYRIVTLPEPRVLAEGFATHRLDPMEEPR